MFITNLNSNRRNLIDEMIDDIFSARLSPEFKLGSEYKPYKIDSDDDDGVILTMNVPGYNKKLIDVTVSNDNLTIEGKANSGDSSGFNHIFTINDNLDSDGIDATVIDGVLTVSIPYAETVKPRKIEVKVK